MSVLRNILAELIGLFVDDWAFALLVLAWVGVFALPGVRAHLPLAGLLLFLGFAALTLAFVARKSQALTPVWKRKRNVEPVFCQKSLLTGYAKIITRLTEP